MKRILCLSSLMFLSLLLFAQQLPKRKELGIATGGTNAYSLIYRTGSATELWRFRAFTMMGNATRYKEDSLHRSSSNQNIGLYVGKEFRKPISEKLEMRYGGDVSLGYSVNRVRRNDLSVFNSDYNDINRTVRVGVNFVCGVVYHVEKNFILGAEVLPGIDLSYGRSRSTSSNINASYTAKGSTRAFGYNLGSSWVMLSAAYKF